MSGTLSPFLGNLSSLESLILSDLKNLTGPIPSELGKLTNLREMYLDLNSIEGSIPSTIESMSQLEALKLTSLKYLDFSNNNLSGSVPGSIQNLSNLTSLILTNNRLSGKLFTSGSEIGIEGSAVSLNSTFCMSEFGCPVVLLTVSGGQISVTGDDCGGWKTHLIALGANLDMSGFGIWTKTVHPKTFGSRLSEDGIEWFWEKVIHLERISAASVSDCQAFPEVLGGRILGDLCHEICFDIVDDPIEGAMVPLLPLRFGLDGDIAERFDLGWHCIRSVAGFEKFGELRRKISGNTYGSRSMGRERSIPPSIGNMESLTYIELSDNELSGPIPNSIGNLRRVDFLNLENNNLSGNIPTTIGNMIRLVDIYLSNNNLTGKIPPALSKLENLLYLELSRNRLSGPIPPQFANLSGPGNLILYGNGLSGPIPPELANINGLGNIFLSNNRLRPDPTPTRLVEFNVSWNRLSGKIPPHKFDFPASDFAGNPGLCGAPLAPCNN
ncbi:LRR receptor-like serine/threonine-protein kinase GSO1 [Salvia splendens]|uniref:LRR receptor-like serine/threonine-protein kinase GSO1 n=1 Tax=Salvia splendens TaxID=180675 RepID=UPI001C27D407|nr:LRR receptor-like serine/threonine-protein kinase GSO1 [Salvia splendens]